MNKYQMTESDKDLFLSGDEGRGSIRMEASKSNPGAESIQIVDSEGNLFDTVTGIEHDGDATDPGFAIVLTDEQLDERRTMQALEAADMSRIEDDLKPKVLAKLKDEARSEVREEFRETIQQLRTEKAELLDKVRRLTEGVSALSRKEEALTEEILSLRARGQS